MRDAASRQHGCQVLADQFLRCSAERCRGVRVDLDNAEIGVEQQDRIDHGAERRGQYGPELSGAFACGSVDNGRLFILRFQGRFPRETMAYTPVTKMRRQIGVVGVARPIPPSLEKIFPGRRRDDDHASAALFCMFSSLSIRSPYAVGGRVSRSGGEPCEKSSWSLAGLQ